MAHYTTFKIQEKRVSRIKDGKNYALACGLLYLSSIFYFLLWLQMMIFNWIYWLYNNPDYFFPLAHTPVYTISKQTLEDRNSFAIKSLNNKVWNGLNRV